jgi:hypothetical protein
MGLLLGPPIILGFIYTLYVAKIGAGILNKSITKNGKVGLHLATVVIFTILISLSIECFFLFAKSGEKVYVFSMLIYILLWPVLTASVLALLIPRANPYLASIKSAACFTVLVVFIFAFMAEDYFYPHFQIETHY